MALLLSESEQVAVLFEVMSMRADWAFAHIAFQHYLTKENDFATWVEGFVDVYQEDLARLADEMKVFVEAREPTSEFVFEPVAEPSFELRFRRSPRPEPGAVLASVAVDIKRVIDLTIPAAYRDNRISLQLRTNGQRLARFAEQFSLEASRVLPSG